MKLFKFLIYFLPWFIGALFNNQSFYQNLSLPFFTPPPFIFIIVWPILYFLIALSIYKIYNQFSFKDNKPYNQSLIMNYIANLLFPISFFTLTSPFLGFVSCLLVLITALNLYSETKNLNVATSKLLIPYIIWDIFASILSLTIYFMNF